MSIAERMRRFVEDTGEDPGDLVREVMRWMKSSAQAASKFAGRVDNAVKDLNRNAASEMEPLADVLRHFESMLVDSAAAAKDTLLATMRFESVDELVQVADNFTEAKNPVISLSRWLIGAKPAVGSYVKKIASSRVTRNTEASHAQVMNALTQIQQALQVLDQHVPTLVKDLTK